MLNVSYRTPHLLNVCTQIEEAQSEFGAQPAAELHELLAEAESFLNAGELLDFRAGEISEDNILSFLFGRRYRAEFRAVGDNPPRLDDGGIAWLKVRRIMLTGISS